MVNSLSRMVKKYGRTRGSDYKKIRVSGLEEKALAVGILYEENKS